LHCHSAPNPFTQRDFGRKTKETLSLLEIRNVPRDLSGKWTSSDHSRLFADSPAHVLGHFQERMTSSRSKVDRVIPDASRYEPFYPTDDSIDAVIDMGEIDYLLDAKHGDWLILRNVPDKERNDPLHPMKIVIVPAVNIAQTKDNVGKAVAARVRIDHRLTGNFARRVRARAKAEISVGFNSAKAVDIAIHFAAAGEDDRDGQQPAILEDVVSHRDVFERSPRLVHQFIHFRMGSEMDHDIRLFPSNGAEDAQILESGVERISPFIRTAIDAHYFMAGLQAPESQIRSDLSTRSSDQYPHGYPSK